MAQIKAATLSNAGKTHGKITDSFLSGGFVPDRFSLETAGHHSISHYVLAASRQTTCFAVFNGLSASQFSAEAAQTAAERLKGEIVRLSQLPLPSAESLIQRFAGQVRSRLAERAAQEAPQQEWGLSFACILFRGNQAIAMNCGSSRVYYCRQGDIRQVSSDQAHGESVCFSSGMITLRDQDRFLLAHERLIQDTDAAAVKASLMLDDPQQAAHQLMSAALEQDDQASVTLTVAVFSELPEPHPGYPQSTAEPARPHQVHPHIEHHNREKPGQEARQVKDEDNAQPGRLSFWTVIPGWLRIVLLIFFILVIVFLGWAFAVQLFK